MSTPFFPVLLYIDLSLVRFVTTELTRGYFLEHNEAKYTERRERVYTCLRIPKELEKVNRERMNSAEQCVKKVNINIISFVSAVDDFWLLPVLGCFSVRVHAIAPQSNSGPSTAPHTAMLRPQVKCYKLRILGSL